jgi:uncharacterized phage infection (PIP) family protein YhgE
MMPSMNSLTGSVKRILTTLLAVLLFVMSVSVGHSAIAAPLSGSLLMAKTATAPTPISSLKELVGTFKDTQKSVEEFSSDTDKLLKKGVKEATKLSTSLPLLLQGLSAETATPESKLKISTKLKEAQTTLDNTLLSLEAALTQADSVSAEAQKTATETRDSLKALADEASSSLQTLLDTKVVKTKDTIAQTSKALTQIATDLKSLGEDATAISPEELTEHLAALTKLLPTKVPAA